MKHYFSKTKFSPRTDTPTEGNPMTEQDNILDGLRAISDDGENIPLRNEEVNVINAAAKEIESLRKKVKDLTDELHEAQCKIEELNNW